MNGGCWSGEGPDGLERWSGTTWLREGWRITWPRRHIADGASEKSDRRWETLPNANRNIAVRLAAGGSVRAQGILEFAALITAAVHIRFDCSLATPMSWTYSQSTSMLSQTSFLRSPASSPLIARRCDMPHGAEGAPREPPLAVRDGGRGRRVEPHRVYMGTFPERRRRRRRGAPTRSPPLRSPAPGGPPTGRPLRRDGGIEPASGRRMGPATWRAAKRGTARRARELVEVAFKLGCGRAWRSSTATARGGQLADPEAQRPKLRQRKGSRGSRGGVSRARLPGHGGRARHDSYGQGAPGGGGEPLILAPPGMMGYMPPAGPVWGAEDLREGEGRPRPHNI